MEWDASTGLALGIVSTLTPWFFSVHSKLATIAEQTAQGAKKIDALTVATGKTIEKLFGVDRKIDEHSARLDGLCERLQEVEETVAE